MQQLCKSDADGSCSTIISFVICPYSFLLGGTVFCKALTPLRVLRFIIVGRWNHMQISAPLAEPPSLRFYPLLGEGSVSDLWFKKCWSWFLLNYVLCYYSSCHPINLSILRCNSVYPNISFFWLTFWVAVTAWSLHMFIYPTFWRILKCWCHKLVCAYMFAWLILQRNLVPLVNLTASVYVLLWH